jgi:hypothetical protein
MDCEVFEEPSSKQQSKKMARSRSSFPRKFLTPPASIARLHTIVERREPALHKRWNKKTNVGRSKLLLSEWPKIQQHHALDSRNWVGGEPCLVSERPLEPSLWPDINLENLTKPRNKLLCVNSRGRNPPQKFVWMDNSRRSLELKKGIIQIEVL